ncbi:hypothetical protein J0X19_22490 [Hymenobacter sp. BT186]|uniref:Uncharacterized protein n=1 Tax=Hymenobacter telluris TaxID=2816474 RepID=A0A939JFS9_9BACT|nr:hypothetical protein [Hymenobacter telluris]MBO0360747.1 hypothetical protein [Hymenobacter telluris]MBW3376775.1 hypothetical protein [Hymenobacter norwichensis]
MSQELDLANKWLDFTIESFVENMRKLRIQDTGTLMASFKKQVIGSAEGRLQLQLSYALYGKFIDMGVGRGMGQGVRRGDDGYDRIRTSRGRLRRKERKARKWYSREMAYQTKRLAELMSELHGTVLISSVSDALPAQDVTIIF